ncbi:MAG: TlpA family protein disulfide reductase [Pontiellaceae bacterium]|nr:TlpA family protein disulfide reductase [Pontiellaceae bacterium]MBN2784963.1 TlpA family protein disulfide reductase [Pontiellaceae bacterium]
MINRTGIHISILCITLTLLFGCSPAPPQGKPASPAEIRAKIDTSKDRLLMVHVWATWCDPCRDEFPELLKAYRKTHPLGLEMMLVSADDPTDPATVNEFLQEHKSPMNSLITTELDQNFIETLSPAWQGALPATFFYDSEGNLLEEWQGRRTYADYVATIERLLKEKE